MRLLSEALRSLLADRPEETLLSLPIGRSWKDALLSLLMLPSFLRLGRRVMAASISFMLPGREELPSWKLARLGLGATETLRLPSSAITWISGVATRKGCAASLKEVFLWNAGIFSWTADGDSLITGSEGSERSDTTGASPRLKSSRGDTDVPSSSSTSAVEEEATSIVVVQRAAAVVDCV